MKYGNMEIRQQGKLKIWKYGNMEIRQDENM
jgi:hypothetical protein